MSRRISRIRSERSPAVRRLAPLALPSAFPVWRPGSDVQSSPAGPHHPYGCDWYVSDPIYPRAFAGCSHIFSNLSPRSIVYIFIGGPFCRNRSRGLIVENRFARRLFLLTRPFFVGTWSSCIRHNFSRKGNLPLLVILCVQDRTRLGAFFLSN